MLKGWSMSHQIVCVFQNGEGVRWEGQFLLARGSGPQTNLAMRLSSHPASEQSIRSSKPGEALTRRKLPGSNHGAHNLAKRTYGFDFAASLRIIASRTPASARPFSTTFAALLW